MFAKTILILFLYLGTIKGAVEIPPELQEFIDEIHNKCLAEVGFTEEDHKAYTLDNKDPKWMCYMECLMLTARWMNSDHVINYEMIEVTAHPKVADLLIAAINKCKKIDGGNQKCEKAYNFNACMYDADPTNWFFV